MATFFYTGLLTDVGVHVLSPDYVPRLTVRPQEEAFGPNGIVSAQPVPVAVNSSTGAFSMELIPSHQLTGRSGQIGVQYVLDLVLRREQFGADGETITLPGWDGWTFTAIAGGGPIAEMGDIPPFGFYIGPPWPATRRPGIYYEPSSGDIGDYRIGV